MPLPLLSQAHRRNDLHDRRPARDLIENHLRLRVPHVRPTRPRKWHPADPPLLPELRQRHLQDGRLADVPRHGDRVCWDFGSKVSRRELGGTKARCGDLGEVQAEVDEGRGWGGAIRGVACSLSVVTSRRGGHRTLKAPIHYQLTSSFHRILPLRIL